VGEIREVGVSIFDVAGDVAGTTGNRLKGAYGTNASPLITNPKAAATTGRIPLGIRTRGISEINS
jgi:hypothetical protein